MEPQGHFTTKKEGREGEGGGGGGGRAAGWVGWGGREEERERREEERERREGREGGFHGPTSYLDLEHNEKNATLNLLNAIIHMTFVPSTLLDKLCTPLAAEMLDCNILGENSSGSMKHNIY